MRPDSLLRLWCYINHLYLVNYLLIHNAQAYRLSVVDLRRSAVEKEHTYRFYRVMRVYCKTRYIVANVVCLSFFLSVTPR